MSRTAKVCRKTSETDVAVELNLDGTGRHTLQTQIPFLDHMLAQLATHGLFDLSIEARGDLQVDLHHTVEDVGIALGEAFAQAMGTSAIPGLGRDWRLYAERVPGRDGILAVARSLESRNEALHGLFREFLVVGPLALLLASLAGYGLAAAALRPVEAMRRRA